MVRDAYDQLHEQVGKVVVGQREVVAGEGWAPQIQVNVVWMKTESRLEPEYNRTAPHPSALPYDRGGVGGVETRGEVEL